MYVNRGMGNIICRVFLWKRFCTIFFRFKILKMGQMFASIKFISLHIKLLLIQALITESSHLFYNLDLCGRISRHIRTSRRGRHIHVSKMYRLVAMRYVNKHIKHFYFIIVNNYVQTFFRIFPKLPVPILWW